MIKIRKIEFIERLLPTYIVAYNEQYIDVLTQILTVPNVDCVLEALKLLDLLPLDEMRLNLLRTKIKDDDIDKYQSWYSIIGCG